MSEKRLPFEEFLLLTAHTQQLHRISLEECNSERKVDAHYPELGAACKMTIGGVSKEDLDEVEMEEDSRSNSQKDVAHLEEVKAAISNQPSYTGEQNNRPRDGEANVYLSYGVEVYHRTPVTTLRADVDHFGWSGLTRNHSSPRCSSSKGIEKRKDGQRKSHILYLEAFTPCSTRRLREKEQSII